jgi:hypothetical protein
MSALPEKIATVQLHVGSSLPYYALIYIDADGMLHHEVSPQFADCSDSILTPTVTEAFLRAVAKTQKKTPPERSKFNVFGGRIPVSVRLRQENQRLLSKPRLTGLVLLLRTCKTP